ncbi:hypothetical protein ACWT_3849 [Actinoplanes sp. SE50]|nr:putative integral membrane protein [Actinoplanes sp. SE50/110]ATO83264.1 hypothetical protein ACWT_3849 [Actinoplanes sp. SE50]SLM00671.1 uncharacterized protein ACSP50_3904 [Actinoplanes sp. SE50/110]
MRCRTAPVRDRRRVSSSPVTAEAEELARLRAEVASLRARLAERPPPQRQPGWQRRTLRRTTAAVLAAIAAFALVTSVVGLWAATTTLNTERWVATVAPLPQDPQVSAAVAEYASSQLFEVLDVEHRLRTVLPQQAAFVAGPITGQIRDQVRKIIGNVLRSGRFQPIWIDLNRRVHQRMLAVLDGRSDVLAARHDRIDIDLLPLINQGLREVGDELPTLFGKQITLPDLSSGAIPDNLRQRVEDQLGVSLPANFAQFTVYDAGRLWAAQQAVATAERDLALFVGATVVLLIAAYAVSPGRRRTTLQLGLWLVVAAVAVTAILRAVRREILAQVPAGTYRDGAAAAITSVFSLLRERGTQLIVIGTVLAVLAYLAGPGRLPRWLRTQVVRGARGIGVGSVRLVGHAPSWIAAHRDPVRIAGMVVAAILTLILSSWTALLVIVVLLAAYEVAVTLIARAVAPKGQWADRAPSQAR